MERLNAGKYFADSLAGIKQFSDDRIAIRDNKPTIYTSGRTFYLYQFLKQANGDLLFNGESERGFFEEPQRCMMMLNKSFTDSEQYAKDKETGTTRERLVIRSSGEELSLPFYSYAASATDNGVSCNLWTLNIRGVFNKDILAELNEHDTIVIQEKKMILQKID